MPTRLLAMLGVSIIVLVAGCSGGDKDPAAATSDTPASARVSQPTYTQFADFPGGELVYTKIGAHLGVRVKPVDTMWTPELAGESADAGQHYFAVYVAVTGELPDRGVDKVDLNGLQLRFRPTAGECAGRSGPVDGQTYCFQEAYPSSELKEVADGEWRA